MSYEQAPACLLCESMFILARFQQMSLGHNIRAMTGGKSDALQLFHTHDLQ